jgi:hypothetical protein
MHIYQLMRKERFYFGAGREQLKKNGSGGERRIGGESGRALEGHDLWVCLLAFGQSFPY